MKAKFSYNLKIDIIHSVDNLTELTELKTPTEMANDIIGLIADECIMSGGVAVCEVLNSELTVK